MTFVIGLLGPAGSGKSTIADYLVERYGAVRYSLSTPLKEFCKNALEFSDAQLYGTQAEKEAPDERYGGKSARWFLQRLGTEGGRKTFGEGFWTEQCLQKITRESPSLAIVDDVRFISEVVSIRKFGVGSVHDNHFQMMPSGYIWRLESPFRESEADVSHQSESEWSKAEYDYVIAPKERGIPQLLQLVDTACQRYNLLPYMRELPL